MTKIEHLKADIRAETERIWLAEPDEIRAMRLGIFPSGAGSYDQFFSNLVFINGDMRALSTWITPGVILRSLRDESFSLDQTKRLFEWTNAVNVDFLAYCGFVRFAEFVRRIIDAFDEITTKQQLDDVLKAWYAYANRMYLWVHQMFPWGLGVAFRKPTEDDLTFMRSALRQEDVRRYFETSPNAPSRPQE